MGGAIKILVVDDLADKILVYTTLLEEEGRQIIAARSGQEALRAVLDHDFAVILLDVNMPGMDGFETASFIRARKRSAHTPIIFVTSHSDEMHALRGYAQGAVDFILAPVVPEILRTKVGVFVELFRLNQQVKEQAAERVARAENRQAHLTSLLERAGDLVAQLDPSGRILHLNAAGRAMLGFDDSDPLPLHYGELLAPGDAAAFTQQWLPTVRREGLWFSETMLRRREGRSSGESDTLPVSQMILAMQTADGEFEHLSVVARDISARVRAEQGLIASEKRYRRLVQSLPAAVYTCDIEGRITLFNQAAVALWGGEPQLGHTQWSGAWRQYNADGTLLAPEDSPAAVTLREGRATRGHELIIERPDGSRSNVLPHPELLHNSAGQVIGVINILVDITDRHRADEARAQLAAIVDSTDDAILSKTPDGIITFINRAAERLFGYTQDEIVGRPVTMLIPPERHAEEHLLLGRLQMGDRVENFETVRLTRDGRALDVSLTVSPVRDAHGRITALSSIARDITQRLRAERALRENEARLLAMFHQAAVGIVLLDEHSCVLEVNDRMCQIVGRDAEQLRGTCCRDLTHPDDWAGNQLLLEQVLTGARSEFAIEKRYSHGDGHWVWINATVSLMDDKPGRKRMVAIIEDISARKHAEHELARHRAHLEELVRERTAELEVTHQRLRLADRLASIGSLAAGLGHDMGNLLLPLRMRLEVLRDMDLPAQARGDVEAIGTVCKYLEHLNHGLRLFALNADDARASDATTDLASWWNDVAPFFRNALPKSVSLIQDFPDQLPRVAMAPHLLAQVVYNLVQNAGDALHQVPGGQVTIAAEWVDGQEMLRLSVIDNGPGMDDEVRKRCIQPFYSTKSRGASSGLGLALVSGALRNAGGSVEIFSKLGHGTTVRLNIPLWRAPSQAGIELTADTAFVGIGSERLRVDVSSILRAVGVRIVTDPADLDEARLLIIDSTFAREQWFDGQLAADPSRQAIIFGAEPPASPTDRTIFVDGTPSAARLRGILIAALCSKPAAVPQVVAAVPPGSAETELVEDRR